MDKKLLQTMLFSVAAILVLIFWAETLVNVINLFNYKRYAWTGETSSGYVYGSMGEGSFSIGYSKHLAVLSLVTLIGLTIVIACIGYLAFGKNNKVSKIILVSIAVAGLLAVLTPAFFANQHMYIRSPNDSSRRVWFMDFTMYMSFQTACITQFALCAVLCSITFANIFNFKKK
ncbi:MAG: hypothetical protein LBG88_02280 [Christensenellaceae bacterium]|jgi:hypothetical protein|nr:hypothetical protein [Christensenellaceae bacterium]